MHHVFFPRAYKLASIVPYIGAFSLHLVIVELTFEVTTILPLEQPLSVLLAFIVLASVGCSVDPVLFTLTVVLII